MYVLDRKGESGAGQERLRDVTGDAARGGGAGAAAGAEGNQVRANCSHVTYTTGS